MPLPEPKPPRVIALDWGTTSLRAYLLGTAGVVLDERAEPWGIMHLPPGGFRAAFDAITGGWPALPAIACGMVGSAQGWVNAPYVPCPAGAGELAAALTPIGPIEAGVVLHVIPGVARGTAPGDRPDVMRGEETQTVGALALHPELADGGRLVLPGTHSKWLHVVNGRIDDFTTYLTGELFAVLRDHSILGRPARDAGTAPDPAAAAESFDEGVRTAREATAGVAPLLFSARARVVTGRLAPAASLEFLSGLLIGDEVRSALGASPPPGRLALVGEPALCARYAAALRHFGVDDALRVDRAAPAGLWAIADRAGFNGRPV